MYLLTTIVSNIVHYDPNTGLRIEWENENDASIIYWVGDAYFMQCNILVSILIIIRCFLQIRLGVNIVLMIAALILWSFLTLSLRNEITMSELQQPEEILEKMTRNNFPLKLAFAWLSHITLFAFWRFWINLVNGMYAAYNHNGNDRK